MPARRTANKDMKCDWKMKKIFMGIIIFLAGLLLFLGADWGEVLMFIGALVVFKGIMTKE